LETCASVALTLPSVNETFPTLGIDFVSAILPRTDSVNSGDRYAFTAIENSFLINRSPSTVNSDASDIPPSNLDKNL
tara:strand:- start:550 stop:780 length:231 start_codon:yes stop_codon:yes gene_type:complete